jgi:hypothetical protein
MAKRTARQRQEFKAMLLQRDGRCLVCGVSIDEDTINPHHITTKGAGGDDRPENGISLCQGCHVAVHNGHHSPASLRWILKLTYHYPYDEWLLGSQDDRQHAEQLVCKLRWRSWYSTYTYFIGHTR